MAGGTLRYRLCLGKIVLKNERRTTVCLSEIEIKILNLFFSGTNGIFVLMQEGLKLAFIETQRDRRNAQS